MIAQAGGSEQGMELAARTAEMVFSLASNIDKNRAFYANVKGRMARYGRDPNDLKILPGSSSMSAKRRPRPSEGRGAGDADAPRCRAPDAPGIPGDRPPRADLDKPFPMDRMPASAKGSKAMFEELKEFVTQGHTMRELITHYARGTPATG